MPDLGELIDRVLRWLEPFYQNYGYLIVFLGSVLEHLFFLAWLMPGGILVAIGGIYAGSGVLSLPLVMLLGTLGAVLGDHVDFFVGRRSSRWLKSVTRGHTMPASFVWSVRAIPALLLAYTNAIPRAAMFMGGSASGLPYRRFLILSASLATFWTSAFSLLGYLLGSNRELLERVLTSVGVAGQVLLLLGAVIAFLSIRRRNRRGARASA